MSDKRRSLAADAYEAGVLAAYEGHSRWSNPYRGDFAANWREGYEDGLAQLQREFDDEYGEGQS